MGSIIIAMPNPTNARQIGDILKRHDLECDCICHTGSEALRAMSDKDGGVIICTMQLKDMNYYELLGYMPDYFSMLLLTRDPDSVETSDRVVKIMNPFKASDLLNSLDMMLMTINRRLKKRKPPKRSEADQALIDKAKELLMLRNEMSEPDAFRYMQKNSMDSGRSMLETAEMILMLNTDC